MRSSSIFDNHHSFLIISEDPNRLAELKSFLTKSKGFTCNSGNPDFWQIDIETFGIEESRQLKNRHLQKAISGKNLKIFAVKTEFITHEAQNALLKVLEDPLPGNYFFFILPSKDKLLPTLLSRFMVLASATQDNNRFPIAEEKINPDYFLKLSSPSRLRLLSDLFESKDKSRALKFLNSLESAYRKKIDFNNLNEQESEILETILKSRKFLNSRGSSIKIILENLSLVIGKY